jgi:hypothetical protein
MGSAGRSKASVLNSAYVRSQSHNENDLFKSEIRREQSCKTKQIREVLNAHWDASAVGDLNEEHEIYDDDAICDYPQVRRANLGEEQFAGIAKSSSR